MGFLVGNCEGVGLSTTFLCMAQGMHHIGNLQYYDKWGGL